MDQAGTIRANENLDWEKLEGYLRENLPDVTGDFSIAQFHGGHANLTYQVGFGSDEFVVRRPPFGKIAPGTHSMKREYRVLSSIHEYYPPAPKAYHLCQDDKIIGSDFIVMERRRGMVIRQELPEFFLSQENIFNRVTKAMVKMQADLHLLDIDKLELNHLGKPEGFLHRQLEGCKLRWDLSQTSEVSDMDPVYKILAENMPSSQKVSLIHNDVKLDNCQFQKDNPDQVSSLFDWDMATLGDPLIDFTSALSYWPDPELIKMKMPVLVKGDFPPKQFLIDLYKDYTGLDTTALSWYESLSFWKLAVIAQQLYKRFEDGETSDKRMKSFGGLAKLMAHRSKKLATSL